MIGTALLCLASSTVFAANKPVVVVFDVQSDGAKLDAAVTGRMGEYVATLLAESGQFQIVPRSEIKKALSGEKAKSYEACYEQSCQIEIGKELAAEKTVATKISRIGSRCFITMNIFDLQRATSDGAASEKTKCDEDAIVDAIDRAVGKLTGSGAASSATKKVAQQKTKTVETAGEGERVIRVRKNRDSLQQGALTIRRVQAALADFQLDGTPRPTMTEAKAILRHVGADKVLFQQGELVIGQLRGDTAMSVWLTAYEVKTCYSVRFGPNSRGFPYHSHNRTYFEICKHPGRRTIDFDKGRLSHDPDLRTIGR